MDWALLRASRDLNPPAPGMVLPDALRTGLTPLMRVPCLTSATVLNISPLPVRSALTGLTEPSLVLTTGSTVTTVLVSRSTNRLDTMAVLLTNAVFVTTTVVVKLWQMKNPGNQKPNQNTGYGTQS
jgi:hypothetical protein